MSRFRIRTTVQLNDDEDMDVIATNVDETEIDETDIPVGPGDFAEYGEYIDADTTDDGRFAIMVFERFDTEYDRTAEVSFPVVITTSVERM